MTSKPEFQKQLRPADAAQQLELLRRDPGYSSGAHIEAAANLVLQFGRPPHRKQGAFIGNLATPRAVEVEPDYESINLRYEQALEAQAPEGWEDSGNLGVA